MSEFVEVRAWPSENMETAERRAVLDWMGRKSKHHMPDGTYYVTKHSLEDERVSEVKLVIGNRKAGKSDWIGRRHDGTFGVIYDSELVLLEGGKFHYERTAA